MDACDRLFYGSTPQLLQLAPRPLTRARMPPHFSSSINLSCPPPPPFDASVPPPPRPTFALRGPPRPPTAGVAAAVNCMMEVWMHPSPFEDRAFRFAIDSLVSFEANYGPERKNEVRDLAAELALRYPLGTALGSSPPMLPVYRILARYSRSMTPHEVFVSLFDKGAFQNCPEFYSDWASYHISLRDIRASMAILEEAKMRCGPMDPVVADLAARVNVLQTQLAMHKADRFLAPPTPTPKMAKILADMDRWRDLPKMTGDRSFVGSSSFGGSTPNLAVGSPSLFATSILSTLGPSASVDDVSLDCTQIPDDDAVIGNGAVDGLAAEGLRILQHLMPEFSPSPLLTPKHASSSDDGAMKNDDVKFVLPPVFTFSG